MTTKIKSKHVTKCTKSADPTDKIKANTDLGKWWRQFCFNHISIIPGSFPKRRPFPKRPVEESGFAVMIRPPYQIYKVEIDDAIARNDFKSRRVDHIVKKMHKSASGPQNGYKEHTNTFKHNAGGAESLQRYREMYAYSRHRLAKINRKRLKKVAQMVKSNGKMSQDSTKKILPKRFSNQTREVKDQTHSTSGATVQLHSPRKEELNGKSQFRGKKNSEKVENTPGIARDKNSTSSTVIADRRPAINSPESRSKSILDGLPPGTYTKRITFIKNNAASGPAAVDKPVEPLKVTSVDFPDESTVSRKSPLGRVINKTFTISTKITKTSDEVQGGSKIQGKSDETDAKPVISTNPPSLPLLRRLRIPEQQAPPVFKYTERMNSLKAQLQKEATDEAPNPVSTTSKPSLAKYSYRVADNAQNKEDNSAVPLTTLNEKNRLMLERLTRSPPAKDVIALTQRFLEKHKKK